MDEKTPDLVPVDATGRFESSYSVHEEDVAGEKLVWDAYMTKVDVRNGLWGCFLFYKMQLLYDSVRELYVVFTRYGRIGENGMNQRTPFPSLDEAKKEFCLIYRQKSGNDFGAKFTPISGKYVHCQV